MGSFIVMSTCCIRSRYRSRRMPKEVPAAKRMSEEHIDVDGGIILCVLMAVSAAQNQRHQH